MSRTFCFALCLAALGGIHSASAQEQTIDVRRDPSPRLSIGQDGSSIINPTPEMWFYEQERSRIDDPKLVMRRRAELRGQQRADRLASQHWYGISNSRPVVSSMPWMGGYAPFWGSNTYDPLRWRPPSAPLVVIRPTATIAY